jgi:hypothetical protein
MTPKEGVMAAIRHGKPEWTAAQARWLCENIGRGGGFILSTCNILTDAVPVANALAMYRAGERMR